MAPSTTALIILAALTPNVYASCKNFTQSTDYRTTPGSTQIVSQGFVCDVPNSNYVAGPPTSNICNATSECPAQSYGTINAVGTNNLSLSADESEPLYELIPQHTTTKPKSFFYSLSSKVFNTTQCLKAPVNPNRNTSIQAGYFGFTPFLNCIEGTLSQCSNGPLEDGTAIRLCAVDTFGTDSNGKNSQVNGAVGFIMTDKETARNVTYNPAANRTAVKTVPSMGAAGRMAWSGITVGVVGFVALVML